MNRKVNAIVMFAAAMIVAACSPAGGGPSGSGGQPIKGGDFHATISSQPSTLDPVATTSATTYSIGSNVLEGLVALDENNRPQPVLAQSFQVSPDYTTFTFTLRTDVTFHNGQKMTTDDVIASAKRWIADSTYGTQFFTGAQVTSPSANVVAIATRKPLFTGMLLLAYPSFVIMPASVTAHKDASGVQDIIGTGPYKFAEWKKDQHIRLEKYAGYKSPPGKSSGLAGEKKPIVDNLFYDIVPDASSRLSGLQTGKYQLAGLSPDQLTQAQNDPNLTTSIHPSGFGFLVFNKKQGLMSDLAMRKAVQSAIDVNAISKAAYTSEKFYQLDGALSLPTQTTTYTTVGTESYNKQDLAKARKYLQEAGYNGQTLRILTTSGDNSAVVIKEQLKAIGVKVDLVVTDFATLVAIRAKPEAWDMFITSWAVVPTPLVVGFLTPSYPGWTNDPAIQQAVTAVNSSTSEDEAKTHYGALQAAVYNYAAIAKFANTSSLTGMQKSIGGLGRTPLLGSILYNVYKTQQ